MRGLTVLLLAVLVGCGRDAAPERAGDAAYAAGRYEAALDRYRAALGRGGEGRLLAKSAAAARRAGEHREAAELLRRLAAEDPTRVAEVAVALEQVARDAERAGDEPALAAAVTALRAVAPGRQTGRWALRVLRAPGASEEMDAAALLPVALAAAPDPDTVDSLLLSYGLSFEQKASCERAVPLYRAALRRSRATEIRSAAGDGLAGCALGLGQVALSRRDPAGAERWFRFAVQVDSTTEAGRRALVGLGQARIEQGDVAGAELAFRAALANDSERDAVSREAAAALDRLPVFQTAGDSAQVSFP